MHGSTHDVPVAVDMSGVMIRMTDWGGMNVALSTFPAGTDTRPIFKGLPDDRCQVPHWGYVLSGRVRVHYADREELIAAGSVFYLEPGHTALYEEDTELIEFSPSTEVEATLEVAQRNVMIMSAASV